VLASNFFRQARNEYAAHTPYPAAAHVDFVHAPKTECYLGSDVCRRASLSAIVHDAMQLITDAKDA
jgi:hypothetical protein